MSRPSGSSVSQTRRPSGSASVSRPSGSAPASRPSGGSVSQSRRPSGSGSVSRPSGGAPATRSGGSVSSSARRPSGGSVTRDAGRPADDVRTRGSAVPGGSARPAPGHVGGDRHPGGNHPAGHSADVARRPGGSTAPARHHADGARRPAPGSRPYADGAYGVRRPSGPPARVAVNHTPGRHGRPAPPPREFRGTPAHFHHAGHHHYGHYIPSPPPRYRVYHYWGRDYYYWDNIWYRYHSGRYWICRPPWGYVFTPLADAVYTACAFSYYFDRLHYYNTVSENAQTIAAQNEAIAANNAVIAAQNERIAATSAAAQAAGDLAASLGLVQSYANAGTEYYYNDGVFYIKSEGGEYTVIVPPAGALVETLPDDYEIVTLGGNDYYKVDDTIYKMVVIEGKAMFEVLGQMVS